MTQHCKYLLGFTTEPAKSEVLPSPTGRGNDGAETDHYQIFCNLPLFHEEGMMVLKPTIIRFSAIRPLSPWERVRERAKPNNLKKTLSEKMATQTRIT